MKYEIKNNQKLYLEVPDEYKAGKLLELKFQVQKGGDLSLFIVTDAIDRQSVSVKVVIKHGDKDAKSKIQMNAVAQDESAVNFFGSVIVTEGIQKISTQLHQRVMLLSDLAKVRLDPVLEIDDNRLTGAHSAVISSPDEKQIKYMQTRGISEMLAKSIIAKSLLQCPLGYSTIQIGQ